MGPVQSTEEIFEQLRGVLHELFEIDPARVTLDAHLYNDLEIDSIDTIDLILRLKELTGRKIQPDQFRHVRTVNRSSVRRSIRSTMTSHACTMIGGAGLLLVTTSGPG